MERDKGSEEYKLTDDVNTYMSYLTKNTDNQICDEFNFVYSVWTISIQNIFLVWLYIDPNRIIWSRSMQGKQKRYWFENVNVKGVNGKVLIYYGGFKEYTYVLL